ncbi:MAG: TrbG/VirB9 family P-type conjugative transfer protein [Nitrospira sp.]|nr:TrbG/VirB9 family P-type conjugative transfer protein [Nitrospira sp.]MDH4354828.1 TrbG/VirB9 family P-type conjugative transfer protein [Nitrospira sp.]MDH5317098.1 TrbG/VirB9 family P-type conjugative transfer protein [Nitrospira sp.]
MNRLTRPALSWLSVSIALLPWSIVSSQAAEIPAPGDGDQRVRYVTYHRDQVTKVTVRRGVVTRIVLGDDERIVIAGSGFLADCAKPEAEWCIRADVGTNQVWVKPKDQAIHNNLEIRTDKRDYSLEFTVVGHSRSAGKHKPGQQGPEQPMYRVIFRHPLVPPNPATMTAMQASSHRAKQAREKTDLLTERLEAFTPEPRNWTYSMEVLPGGEDIAPALVFDDGRFTYFSFPPNHEIPAIFFLSPLGEETRLNFHMEKGLAVVQRLGRRFVLRLGEAVVGVWNEAYDSTGVPTVEGTTVSGITRTLR